jgi:hypothetical protein
LLQNDFAHLGAQDRFKIGRQCAMLIQKSMPPDSIVSNFYSTASPWRLLQQYRHYSDLPRRGVNGPQWGANRTWSKPHAFDAVGQLIA